MTRRTRRLAVAAATVGGAVCAIIGYLTGQLYERLTRHDTWRP
jgi:hypothetical protein